MGEAGTASTRWCFEAHSGDSPPPSGADTECVFCHKVVCLLPVGDKEEADSEKTEKKTVTFKETPLDLRWNPATTPSEVRGHIATQKSLPRALCQHNKETIAKRCRHLIIFTL